MNLISMVWAWNRCSTKSHIPTMFQYCTFSLVYLDHLTYCDLYFKNINCLQKRRYETWMMHLKKITYLKKLTYVYVIDKCFIIYYKKTNSFLEWRYTRDTSYFFHFFIAMSAKKSPNHRTYYNFSLNFHPGARSRQVQILE